MAPTAHSQFSASASARWLACPGSFELGLPFDTGVRRSSVYAAEGTLAHAISEACLFAGRDPVDFLGQTRKADGFEFTIDEDFVSAVQVYVDYLRGLRALGYVIMLERRVTPQVHWTGKKDLGVVLFGTSDCIAYNPITGHLIIVDLKFGRGIAVEVVDNSQLMYYASGSLCPNIMQELADATGNHTGPVVINTVDLVVVQPRAAHPLGPIRSASYDPKAIIHWAQTVLYNGVERALTDKGNTLKAGKHCRFCPVLPHCKAAEALTYDAARTAFANAPLDGSAPDTNPTANLPVAHLSDAKLGELLDKIEIIAPYLDAVRKLGQERIEAGNQVPGWKVVPKRSIRRWAAEPDEILDALDQTALDKDKFSVRSLMTPAQVEKKVGKQAYLNTIAPHVVKNSSGLTLAPEGDPRARVQGRTAQEAFGLPAPTTADPNSW